MEKKEEKTATTRGLHKKCPYCGSKNVDFITRVTGFFSKVSSWNKGKVSELKDRDRVGKQFKKKDDKNED